MKNIFLLVALSVAICGCGHNHNSEEAHDHEHLHIHNFTAYTAANEYFMQHEGLVSGEKSCITLFVTRLSDFKPTGEAHAKAVLKVGDSVQEAVTTADKAGIFHFELVPEASGEAALLFEVNGDKAHFHVHVDAAHAGHNHDAHAGHDHVAQSHEDHNHDAHAGHDHAAHVGHDHAAHSHEDHNHDAHAGHDHAAHAGHDHAAHAGHSHEGHGEATEGAADDVAFGKEQSWKIDFATAVVEKSHFGGVVKVAAKVAATPENFTTIVATASGKVQFVGNLVEGKEVVAGQPLFYLEGGDVTDNDAAVKFAEAESAYLLAKSDYERKKSLFAEKVVSEREYQAAEAAYRQAEARFASMERNFAGGKVTLKSARSGYVAALLVANGDYVEPGTPLATVQTEGAVNITCEFPVRFSGQLRNISDVNIELPSGEAYSMNALGGSVVAVGSAANACNMLPLTVSAGSLSGLVPGSVVTLYIISENGTATVAVPRTALVEEMGNLFVFVQNNPISFEKRAVKVGAGDGINVQITSGLNEGERIVAKGAVSLKLSQGAVALDPHAGHVH